MKGSLNNVRNDGHLYKHVEMGWKKISTYGLRQSFEVMRFFKYTSKKTQDIMIGLGRVFVSD